MSATVELVNASGQRRLPLRRQFRQWAAELNGHYRNKAYATNVLSFPVPASLQAAGQLGDLALCAAVVKKEAQEQNKTATDHWAHLVVHGVLHLLGYDHERKKDASIMEALEVRILAGLGIKDPYQQ